jgi:diguanylate cyclase (GGDEF)-like protein
LNLWSVIPLLSCIAYAILLAAVLFKARTKVLRVFAVFLFVSFLWSLSSFLLTCNPPASVQYLVFWNDMVVAGVVASIVAYYHFVLVYTNRPTARLAYVGYALVLVILALSAGGYVVKSATLVDGYLFHDMGPWVGIMVAVLVPTLAVTLWMLGAEYRRSSDPLERNKLAYLMVGLGIVGVYGPVNSIVPQLAGLPTDHLGTLANALIITFAVRRYQLLDIGLLARRTLAYTVLFFGIIGIYMGLVLIVVTFQPQFLIPDLLLLAVVLSLVMLVLFRPLRYAAEERIDRLFHCDTYARRQLLLDFGQKISDSLDLEEVSHEMLSTIGKSLRPASARLLLRDVQTGDFSICFAYPDGIAEAGNRVSFARDNPLVAWLSDEGKPLHMGNVGSVNGFDYLPAEEKARLLECGLAVLLPMISRGRLIGILALGKIENGRGYRAEDIELAISMARQASILTENAQLYAQAQQRANVDELTGLYNHRYLHQRLDEEVARSSRFGEVFSLLILDLDSFKAHNDIYGHLYGDKVLKRVGEHIKDSIRDIDIGFRYGGDEFAVILPQTSLDGALKVADRIRKSVESDDNDQGMLLTCSAGLASWPADGVMREEIIQASDAALYQAKQAGKNRVCLASKTAITDVSRRSPIGDNSLMALNTIYALAATVDAKDHYTYGHSKKVSKYSADIASALGYSEDRTAAIRTAGLLHDIGKIGVSDQILRKPGRLNDAEWEPVHAHPNMGVSIIKHIEGLKDCLAAVQYHHERFDGMGYPTGLKGDNIPLDARILAVADSYDAMTSQRPYRNRPRTNEEALEELINCAGKQFDPQIVTAFVKIMTPPDIKKGEASFSVSRKHPEATV